MRRAPFLGGRWMVFTAALAALGGPGQADSRPPERRPSKAVARLTGGDPIKLVPSRPSNEFPSAVALSGSLAAVGDRLAEGTGAVFLFERDEGGLGHWGQVALIVADDGEFVELGGHAVALDGDRLAASAAGDGSVHVFERRGAVGGWTLVTKLAPEPAPRDEPAAADDPPRAEPSGLQGSFGTELALDGDTLVVGAADDNTVYVFEADAGGPDNWGQVAKLFLEDGNDRDKFGDSIAIDGDTIVIGAWGYSAGAAFVYERDAGGEDKWGQVAVLQASSPDRRAFGWFAALDGETAVVASRENYVLASREKDTGPGRAIRSPLEVFARDPDDPERWLLTTTIYPHDWQIADRTSAIAVDGGLLVEGVSGDDLDRGSAAVFARDAGGASVWGQYAKLTASDVLPANRFGAHVAISGRHVLVGEDTPPGFEEGAAYIFALEAVGPFLQVSGDCPGRVRIEVVAGRPKQTVALAGSFAAGSFVLADGPCAGTELGLDQPALLGSGTSDELGNLALELDLGDGPCGAYLQALMPSTCGTSVVGRLPRRRWLRYDPGEPADFFRRGIEAEYAFVGNVFDSALGSPLGAGSLSAVQVYLARDRESYVVYPNHNVTMAVFPYPPVPSGTVVGLDALRIWVLQPSRSAFETHVLANPLRVPPRFLLGHRLSLYYTHAEGRRVSGQDLGMHAGTVLGQGHHGFELDRRRYEQGTGRNFRRLDANAMIRAYGTFGPRLLPVELMSPRAEANASAPGRSVSAATVEAAGESD